MRTEPGKAESGSKSSGLSRIQGNRIKKFAVVPVVFLVTLLISLNFLTVDAGAAGISLEVMPEEGWGP